MKQQNPIQLSIADAQRFRNSIAISITGCHDWLGVTRNGYATFSIAGKMYRAARIAWSLANAGRPAIGLVVRICGNRACVNPEHLALSSETKAHRKAQCKRGHALAGPNLIQSLLWAGHACRACDTAARAARHKELTGPEREAFIQARADEAFARFTGQPAEAGGAA